MLTRKTLRQSPLERVQKEKHKINIRQIGEKKVAYIYKIYNGLSPPTSGQGRQTKKKIAKWQQKLKKKKEWNKTNITKFTFTGRHQRPPSTSSVPSAPYQP